MILRLLLILLLPCTVWARGNYYCGASNIVGGFDCTGYTLYSTLDLASLVTSPTCGPAGSYSDMTFPGEGIKKSSSSSSKFSFPESAMSTSSAEMTFTFIPSHSSAASSGVWGSEDWNYIFRVSYGSYTSMAVMFSNGGTDTQGVWEIIVITDTGSSLTASTGVSANYYFTQYQVIGVKVAFDKSSGDVVLSLDYDNNGVYEYTATRTGAAFTMDDHWGRSSDTIISFWNNGTNESVIKDLTIQ